MYSPLNTSDSYPIVLNMEQAHLCGNPMPLRGENGSTRLDLISRPAPAMSEKQRMNELDAHNFDDNLFCWVIMEGSCNVEGVWLRCPRVPPDELTALIF